MMLRTGALFAGLAAPFLLWGCETTTRHFAVTSFPEGATVYVDGEPRGQTNFARLEINFEPEEKLVTLRIEKEGYQPTGIVLSKDSPRQLAFFMAQAPRNDEILTVLKSILQVLDRLSTEMRPSAEGPKQ